MNALHSEAAPSLLAAAAGTHAKVLACVGNLHANLLLYRLLYQLEGAGLRPYYLPLFFVFLALES